MFELFVARTTPPFGHPSAGGEFRGGGFDGALSSKSGGKPAEVVMTGWFAKGEISAANKAVLADVLA
jgi:hypothetical protein